ncbi:MAG: Asp-tRNA(Asn)/Glu-tRNA(Gln) amidotransferase subunit GatC [Gammaproteobacteria bacterium]|nr:MAG: Asp-tRNA(Asn)/Glu-tRNA(Gln) amidotransferase subunit GatC [Gammaproteobacteria bacterium]
MIDRDTVSQVAGLARIRVSEAEIPELTQRLGNILAMVDALQAADTQGIEPLSNPLDATQRLRPDAVTEPNQRDRLLALAPASEQGLFLVPRVIE